MCLGNSNGGSFAKGGLLGTLAPRSSSTGASSSGDGNTLRQDQVGAPLNGGQGGQLQRNQVGMGLNGGQQSNGSGGPAGPQNWMNPAGQAAGSVDASTGVGGTSTDGTTAAGQIQPGVTDVATAGAPAPPAPPVPTLGGPAPVPMPGTDIGIAGTGVGGDALRQDQVGAGLNGDQTGSGVGLPLGPQNWMNINGGVGGGAVGSAGGPAGLAALDKLQQDQVGAPLNNGALPPPVVAPALAAPAPLPLAPQLSPATLGLPPGIPLGTPAARQRAGLQQIMQRMRQGRGHGR